MPKAIWNNTLIAQASTQEIKAVEGNIYFPASTVDSRYLQDSDHHTICHWKGVASYYDLIVNGQVNANAAWYYPTPKDGAAEIAGYIAFWKGVQIIN